MRHPNGKGVSSHTAAQGSILGEVGCLTINVALTHLAKQNYEKNRGSNLDIGNMINARHSLWHGRRCSLLQL